MTEARYPWTRWLRPKKRRSRLLQRGRDFDCSPRIMAQQVRNRANYEGLYVTLNVGRDSVTIASVRSRA